MKLLHILILIPLLISCTKTNPLNIGNGKEVVVELELLDLGNLENISFSSNNIDTTLYPKDLQLKTIINFSFDLRTDRSFFIGAKTKNKTFGILGTIESGQRPVFTLDEDTLKCIGYKKRLPTPK